LDDADPAYVLMLSAVRDNTVALLNEMT